MIHYPISSEAQAAFKSLADVCEQATSVAICAHTNPDGDAIGSQLALGEVLRAKWPQLEITQLLADDEPCPRMYEFLDGSDKLRFASDCDDVFDIFFCVDLSLVSRLENAERLCERSRARCVLDHHPSNECFWDAGYVEPKAAAAGVLVYEFARYLGVSITPSIAQALMCALVTDTGRFQYQNTDAWAFVVASGLVEAGADPARIALEVYQSDRLPYLHLEAKVMSRVQSFCEGKIAYSYATASEIEQLGVDLSECEGLVDVVRRVEKAEVVLFLKEQGSGSVRGNLRAKGDADISSVARELGGGGHKAAAGFTFEGDIDQALSAVLPKLKATLGISGEGIR